MLAVLKRSCDACRSQLIIENREEVTEKKVDGRKILTVTCPCCGEVNEIMRNLDKLKITQGKFQ